MHITDFAKICNLVLDTMSDGHARETFMEPHRADELARDLVGLAPDSPDTSIEQQVYRRLIARIALLVLPPALVPRFEAHFPFKLGEYAPVIPDDHPKAGLYTHAAYLDGFSGDTDDDQPGSGF